MEKFTKLKATMVAMPTGNIDTDQIIPARFLKVTDKNGLGENLFYDWRYHADGSPKEDFILNTEQGHKAQILVAGDNFGCGSSREHAPWAIMGFGPSSRPALPIFFAIIPSNWVYCRSLSMRRPIFN